MTATKRKRGRPRVERPATTKITAAIPEDAAVALRARAEAEDRTPSACIREAIERWLDAAQDRRVG